MGKLAWRNTNANAGMKKKQASLFSFFSVPAPNSNQAPLHNRAFEAQGVVRQQTLSSRKNNVVEEKAVRFQGCDIHSPTEVQCLFGNACVESLPQKPTSKETSSIPGLTISPQEISPQEECVTDDGGRVKATVPRGSCCDSEGLSEYEKLRLANIARNQEFLRNLGLQGAMASTFSGGSKPFKGRQPGNERVKRKRKELSASRAMPTRRSTRTRLMPASIYNPDLVGKSPSAAPSTFASFDLKPPDTEPTEDMLPFDDSSIFAYMTNNSDVYHQSKNCIFDDHVIMTTGSKVARLKDIGGSKYFCDSNLKKIYSMSFQSDLKPNIFVAGGHGGRVAVFGVHDIVSKSSEGGDNLIDSLMSYKAHSGWISTVQFLSNRSTILLTASNDAVVTLWDLTQQLATDRARDVRPKVLTTKNDLHANGIFSAHEMNNKVVTASKDKSVGFSEIVSESGVIRSLRELNFHTGVVKCARLRDENVLASCGNDQSIGVYDVRTAEGIIMHVDNASTDGFALNSVAWHPRDENALMSACFGNAIQVWDLRKFSAPVKTLKGHAQLHDGGRGKIYHPCFINGGKTVLTAGHKSESLSLFDFGTGSLESKGRLDFGEAATVEPSDEWGSLIAAAKGSKVILLKPEFSED